MRWCPALRGPRPSPRGPEPSRAARPAQRDLGAPVHDVAAAAREVVLRELLLLVVVVAVLDAAVLDVGRGRHERGRVRDVVVAVLAAVLDAPLVAGGAPLSPGLPGRLHDGHILGHGELCLVLAEPVAARGAAGDRGLRDALPRGRLLRRAGLGAMCFGGGRPGAAPGREADEASTRRAATDRSVETEVEGVRERDFQHSTNGKQAMGLRISMSF